MEIPILLVSSRVSVPHHMLGMELHVPVVSQLPFCGVTLQRSRLDLAQKILQNGVSAEAQSANAHNKTHKGNAHRSSVSLSKHSSSRIWTKLQNDFSSVSKLPFAEAGESLRSGLRLPGET